MRSCQTRGRSNSAMLVMRYMICVDFEMHNYFCVVSESPQHLLLQALNDQNQAAIDECLATKGVKDWINRRALPEQLDNPIRQFKDVKTITCLSFASLVSDEAT